MKMPTKIHAALDYITAIGLVGVPWLFNLAPYGAETWVPVLLGIATVIYSLCTNYELGYFRTISMRTHLRLDILNGLFLAVSPWLFGFANYVWMPHVVVGLIEIAVPLFTSPVSSNEHGKQPGNNAEQSARL
jgi:hypothetical protein